MKFLNLLFIYFSPCLFALPQDFNLNKFFINASFVNGNLIVLEGNSFYDPKMDRNKFLGDCLDLINIQSGTIINQVCDSFVNEIVNLGTDDQFVYAYSEIGEILKIDPRTLKLIDKKLLPNNFYTGYEPIIQIQNKIYSCKPDPNNMPGHYKYYYKIFDIHKFTIVNDIVGSSGSCTYLDPNGIITINESVQKVISNFEYDGNPYLNIFDLASGSGQSIKFLDVTPKVYDTESDTLFYRTRFGYQDLLSVKFDDLLDAPNKSINVTKVTFPINFVKVSPFKDHLVILGGNKSNHGIIHFEILPF